MKVNQIKSEIFGDRQLFLQKLLSIGEANTTQKLAHAEAGTEVEAETGCVADGYYDECPTTCPVVQECPPKCITIRRPVCVKAKVVAHTPKPEEPCVVPKKAPEPTTYKVWIDEKVCAQPQPITKKDYSWNA